MTHLSGTRHTACDIHAAHGVCLLRKMSLLIEYARFSGFAIDCGRFEAVPHRGTMSIVRDIMRVAMD